MAPELSIEADYRTLGLQPGSTPSEVRRAYRELVKKWHPDRHHSKNYEARALAEKKFREIDEAYKRIAAKRKETPRSERSADPSPSPGNTQRAQHSQTKARVSPAAWSWSKILSPISKRIKIIWPALLLLITAAYIFIQLSSYLHDKAVITENRAPQNNDNSLIQKDANPEQSLVTPVPQKPGDLTSPSSPAPLPPQLLQPQPAAPNTFFTLGSATSEVLKAQGSPSRIQGQTWIYGLSEVHFTNGRVSRFNNFDGSLHIQMLPGSSGDHNPPDHITLGSSEDEVLLVQGTPTRVEGDRWFYGFAEVKFKKGNLVEYDNYFGALKMKIQPNSLPSDPSGNFTIGSSPDEVLTVQGTPTAIHGNRWSYNFSSVIFRDGKVISVVNSEKSLRFVTPEEN